MSDPNLPTTSPVTPPVDQDWREERRARRRSGDQPWLGGLILIGLGVIFLLQNISGFQFRNWWALFILIPALGALGTAWSLYQRAGRFNRAARSAFFSGLVMLAITAIFLFEMNLNWNLIWPVLLIVIGLGMLINFMLPD